MLPLSILPLVFGGCFLLIWAFIAWIEYEKYLDAARHDCDAPNRAAY